MKIYYTTLCKWEFLYQSLWFYQPNSPVSYSDLFGVNIPIAPMHRITTIILDVSNDFHNTDYPIHERVFVILQPYYLDWFEKTYPYIPLNQDYIHLFLKCVHIIQGTRQEVRQYNQLLGYLSFFNCWKGGNICASHKFISQKPPFTKFIVMFNKFCR